MAGVGAIATQALANVSYGPDGLAALAGGNDATTVVADLTAADDGRSERQLGIVDARGRAATHTGTGCCLGGWTRRATAWRSRATSSPARRSWTRCCRRSRRRAARCRTGCSTALLAGDRAGGDARGRQSAALLVVRAGGGYGGDDRSLDRPAGRRPRRPGARAARLLDIWRLLSERPTRATSWRSTRRSPPSCAID